MAITLSGSPQELTAGYNPMYFYGSSTNVNQSNFRYLVSVSNQSTSTTLADLKIKPRYGDDLLEVNISKIINNDLGCFSEDIDFNTAVTGFTNAPSVGYEYRINVGEEYYAQWEFGDTIFNSGMVRLTGTTDSGYVAGDAINVVNAAEDFEYDYIASATTGRAAFHSVGHSIVIGDSITVEQDSQYTFAQYNGTWDVEFVYADFVILAIQYQGDTIGNESGTLVRNKPYDGLQIVVGAGAVGGNYYVDINQPWIDNSPTHTGYTEYNDGRLTQTTGLAISDNHVFNGAIRHADWVNWDWNDYNPSGTGQKFLTTLPDGWNVTLDNDVFLDIWGNKISLGMYKMVVRTYDAASSLIGQYEVLNPNLYTAQDEFQNVSVGPRGLNQAIFSVVSGSTGTTQMIDCDVDNYTINIITAFAVEQSDYRAFNVDCSCINKFTNYPILFKDKFGSYVPFNFSLNNKQKVNVSKRDTYKKFIGGLDSGEYTYSLNERSNSIFNIDFTETWTLNTDWLTEAEAAFFEELITTNEASILINDVYHAVYVTDRRYERLRKINEKNIRYKLDVRFANDNTSQSG